MARNYSNVAEETALGSAINSSATSIIVGSNTGYPAVPYTIIVDPGLVTEEVCEVTAVAGTTWTVTRGVDGTPASSHDLGAVVVHGYSARDLRDIQDHIGASTGVHGVTGSVVGTSATQTLTNKTLTSPTISGGTISGVTFGSGLTFTSPTLITPTIASFVNAQHNHTDAASGGTISGGGGSFTPVVYKRSHSDDQVLTLTVSNYDGAKRMSFDTQVYNDGNATWSTLNSNARIVLPTDINNGVWHVTAGATIVIPWVDAMPFLVVAHQDLGNLAVSGAGDGLGDTSSLRRLCVSAEFKAASGRWLEIRLATDDQLGDYTVIEPFLAIHRIA